MTAIMSLQKAVAFEIEKYEAPKDARSLSKTHVPFTGAPRKHPLNPDQIILIPDPYNPKSTYLEFNRNDITHVEKLAHVTNIDGETVSMARIWVKKGGLAVQCTPFHVSTL